MYKIAGQNLHRRTRTHDLQLAADSHAAADVLPDLEQMNTAELEAERAQLCLEHARESNELVRAKAAGRRREIAAIGNRIQALEKRMSRIGKRLKACARARHDQAYRQAVRNVVDEVTLARIHAEQERILAEGKAGGAHEVAP